MGKNKLRPALAAFLLMLTMSLLSTALSFFVSPVCVCQKALYGIDPFIIDDKRRGAYNRGIEEWETNQSQLILVTLEAQKRFQGKMELCNLFQYARYPSVE